MKEFSKIEYAFEDFIKEVENEREKSLLKTDPFPKDELTGAKQIKRIAESIKTFWKFDTNYFTASLYDKYAKPNRMLKTIAECHNKGGYHLFLGPRKHGKTATGKKLLIWKLITGQIKVAGVYAETLNKSSNILKDVFKLISDNDRLLHDFVIEFKEANSDQIAFSIYPKVDIQNFSRSTRYCASFSEGRSVRGYTRLFNRPQFLLADDVETLESSFSKSSVNLRIDKLVEAYNSLEDNSTFIILGNDIVVQSAMHQLRMQAEENLLPKSFNLYVFKAWERNQPLWKERYPAKTIDHLRKLIDPLSESDWQANYMQNPIPPEGFFFTREHYIEHNALPADIKSVLYCDPNLSKKGKGDTTAITVLGYSPKTDKYYIAGAVCKSFSDANILLNTVFELKNNNKRIYAIGFDGNVAQESTWTQFVRNWCTINRIPFPLIEYKHYRVNELAKNIQLAFNTARILFPKNFAKSEEGSNYLNQLFSFTGEKKGGLDDAPDSLICAFEFLHERKLAYRHTQKIKTFNDYYKL